MNLEDGGRSVEQTGWGDLEVVVATDVIRAFRRLVVVNASGVLAFSSLANWGPLSVFFADGVAVCAKRGNHNAIPSVECSCGFYGCGDSATVDERVGNDGWLAEVSFGGTVIECEQGWRASHQRVDKVHVPASCQSCQAPTTRLARGRGAALAASCDSCAGVGASWSLTEASEQLKVLLVPDAAPPETKIEPMRIRRASFKTVLVLGTVWVALLTLFERFVFSGPARFPIGAAIGVHFFFGLLTIAFLSFTGNRPFRSLFVLSTLLLAAAPIPIATARNTSAVQQAAERASISISENLKTELGRLEKVASNDVEHVLRTDDSVKDVLLVLADRGVWAAAYTFAGGCGWTVVGPAEPYVGSYGDAGMETMCATTANDYFGQLMSEAVRTTTTTILV